MGKALEAITKPFASLIGGSAPKMPTVTAPTPMPDVDDKAATEARRRRVAELQARSGRLSTVLGGGESRDTLGA